MPCIYRMPVFLILMTELIIIIKELTKITNFIFQIINTSFSEREVFPV